MSEPSLADLGVSPVPGETPAGADARYEPEYAAVLDEIEKLSFSGQGAAISWPVIEKNAALILAEKSKDIQIASYLGVALEHTKGLQGMLDGVRVLTGILENFWPTAWPALKRMRGRVNAMDWWHDRSSAFLQDLEGENTPVPAEIAAQLPEALEKLDSLSGELMPDAIPLRDLVSMLRRLPVDAPPEAPAAPAAEAPASPAPEQAAQSQPVPEQTASVAPEQPQPAPAPQTAATAPAPAKTTVTPTQPAPNEELPKLRRQFTDAALAYLAPARRAEPNNAALWRILRLVVWNPIIALPAAENGQTMLPAPDLSALAQARQKMQAGDALGAALEAENFFPTAPFCLEAQALIHTALAALGAPYAEAAAVVRDEAAAFFARLPGMDKLSFTDGSPFVPQDILPWLRSAKKQSGGASGGGGGLPAALEKAMNQARELAGQQQLAEALALLDAAKGNCAADNLRLGIQQSRLLLEAGKTETALALAEALLEDVDAHALEGWDPPLALDCLLAARDAFSLVEEQYADKLPGLRRRIARLSAAKALE